MRVWARRRSPASNTPVRWTRFMSLPFRRSLTGLPSRSGRWYTRQHPRRPSTLRAMALNDALDRYFDGWNTRDGAAVVAALTPGGTYEDPTTGGPLSGDALAANVDG